MEEGNQEKNSIKMKRTRSITVNTKNKNLQNFFKLKIVAIKLPIMSGLLHIWLKNRYFS